eukprot:130551-Hanusia_phi.AAC.2
MRGGGEAVDDRGKEGSGKAGSTDACSDLFLRSKAKPNLLQVKTREMLTSLLEDGRRLSNISFFLRL